MIARAADVDRALSHLAECAKHTLPLDILSIKVCYRAMINTSPRPRAVPKPAPDFTSRAYWNGTIKMSLSKFFILCVLHQKPMHGYDIAGAVERATEGNCSPTEGTIYPALREFEEGGYVTSNTEVVSGRVRKVYTLTKKGREAFKVAVEAWMEVTQCLIDSGRVAAVGDQRTKRDACCK